MSGEHTLKLSDMDGRPSIVVYETQSGVIAHVTPLSLPTLRAIQLKAKDEFPYPDPRPYQVPEENAFVETQLTPAEDNPDYVAACHAVDNQRKQWLDRAVFDYAVHFPKYPTPRALVDGFRERLDALRKIAVLPEDDYEAVLFHLVLTWNQVGITPQGELRETNTEYARLIQLAIQTVALTPDEVTAGVRFFRPYLPEHGAGTVDRRTSSVQGRAARVRQ